MPVCLSMDILYVKPLSITLWTNHMPSWTRRVCRYIQLCASRPKSFTPSLARARCGKENRSVYDSIWYLYHAV